MEVVVDTSVLRDKYPLQGVSARYLQAFAGHHGTSIVIPEVVVLEMTRWIEDEVRKAFNQFRQSARTVRRFGDSDVLEVAGDAEDTEVNLALRNLDRSMKEIDTFVAPIPHGITHKQVIDRLHSSLKPFTGTSNREKGYRDYLIWETILSLGGIEGERDENGRIPIAFLTANTRDFADETGSLHPDLRVEAEAAGLSITLYTSMDKFIDTIVEPTLPTSAKAASLLEEEAAKAAIREFISEEFSTFAPYPIAGIGHPYDAEIEDVTVDGFDVVAVEYIEDVVDLAGGTAAAQVAVQAEASVNFFVWRADAYAWDDDLSASLSDWNERYLLGETVIVVEGAFRVEFEVMDGSLRPISLDVVAITPAEAGY